MSVPAKLWKYTWTGYEQDLSILSNMIDQCTECKRAFDWSIEEVKNTRILLVTTKYTDPTTRKQLTATIAKVEPNTTIEVDDEGTITLTIPAQIPTRKGQPVTPPFMA